MQKACLALAFLCLLASACSPAANQPPVTAAIVSPATQTPTLSSTLTATPQPTLTPAPTTTSLPTISTFTPTFDVRTIVTATLVPRAKCPKTDDSVKFIDPSQDTKTLVRDYKTAILDFLNKGGEISAAFRHLSDVKAPADSVALQDITGDELPELIFVSTMGGIFIFGCDLNTSLYNVYYEIPYDFMTTYQLVGINDMNLDSIPEVIFSETGCLGERCGAIDILEWNGKALLPLKAYDSEKEELNNRIYASEMRAVSLADTDGNGTLELIWKGGIPPDYTGDYQSGPWRIETHVYAWNGEYFVSYPTQYALPLYLFQAIQDADQNVLTNQYKQALLLLKDVIVNKDLEGWSRERYQQQGAFQEAEYLHLPKPTPFPTDSTEYPRLAAYAYYRMIILHTYLGEMDVAKIQYTTLQEKFPAGNPGHPYVEMATAFWQSYQYSGKMYNACAAAITYADAHPEILTVLGSDYHGWQSHIYVPADVCPFR